MKYIALLLAVSLSAQAQTKPPSRPAPIISPEMQADSVTFRLRAPDAKSVSVRGQWSKQQMNLTRGDEGIWSGAASDIPAGVWEYSLVVDGVSMLDPGNSALKPMREPRTSILHLPSTPPAPWDFQDVPHGTVHQHSYLSKALGRAREVWVYTPPGYESALAEKYPLLVLQHGSGDNHQTWVAHGKAHWILDSLIATGKAKPMIIVMLDGHPLGSVRYNDPARRGDAMDAFRRELFEDALPLVEKAYRVEKETSQRGIVGLSMGGGQSLTVGLGNLDKFAWVGAFSAAPADEVITQKIVADAAGTNAKLKLLWIGCGKDDFLLKINEDFISKLKAGGIKHDWQLTEGGHSWPIWRDYLTEFLPRLFK